MKKIGFACLFICIVIFVFGLGVNSIGDGGQATLTKITMKSNSFENTQKNETIPPMLSWQNSFMINNVNPGVLATPVANTTDNFKSVKSTGYNTNVTATTKNTEGQVIVKKHFQTKIMLPKASQQVRVQGVVYQFRSPQGMVSDADGNTYVLYSPQYTHGSTKPEGAPHNQKFDRIFIMKISKNVKDLSEQQQLNRAVQNGDVQLSQMNNYGYHGSMLSYVNKQVYLTTASTESIFDEKTKKLQTSVTLYKVSSQLKFTQVASGSFSPGTYKTSFEKMNTGVISNFTMATSHKGYFITNGTSIRGRGYQSALQQKDGYTIWQVLIKKGQLIIYRLPLVLMNRLGESGNNGEKAKRNSVQAITYYNDRLYINSDDAWLSVNMQQYTQLANHVIKNNFETGYDEKKRVKNRRSLLLKNEINVSWTKLSSNQEQENLSFDAQGKMMLLLLGKSQIVIQK